MDSASWQDLAAQFVRLALEPNDQELKRQFEVLARRGASWLNPTPLGDFLKAWVETVRGRKGDNNSTLLIPNERALCGPSADFCNVKQYEALRIERRPLLDVQQTSYSRDTVASDSWRELAEAFERIDDPHGFIRAFWKTGTDGVNTWKLECIRNEVPAQFATCRACMARAGKLLDPSAPDYTARWLDEILSRRSIGQSFDGAGGAFLGKLATASGILCRALEEELLIIEPSDGEDVHPRSVDQSQGIRPTLA